VLHFKLELKQHAGEVASVPGQFTHGAAAMAPQLLPLRIDTKRVEATERLCWLKSWGRYNT